MKECEKYAALLDAFAEGDLFTEDLIQVQRHLMDCPDCQAYLEDLMAMRAAFPTVEETEVPEGFSARVMAAVAQTPQSSIPPAAEKKPAKKAPWGRVLASLAACCAIVILMKSPILDGGSSAPAAKFAAQAETAAAPAEAKMMAEPGAPAPEEAMEESAVEDAVLEGAAETPAETEMAVNETYSYTTSTTASGAETGRTDLTLTADTAPQEAETPPLRDGTEFLLTAQEVGDLLQGFTPAAETETEALYLLSARDYISLLTALPREVRQSAPASTAETMRILVLK